MQWDKLCNTVYCGLINININTDVQENVQIGCTGYVHSSLITCSLTTFLMVYVWVGIEERLPCSAAKSLKGNRETDHKEDTLVVKKVWRQLITSMNRNNALLFLIYSRVLWAILSDSGRGVWLMPCGSCMSLSAHPGHVWKPSALFLFPLSAEIYDWSSVKMEEGIPARGKA